MLRVEGGHEGRGACDVGERLVVVLPADEREGGVLVHLLQRLRAVEGLDRWSVNGPPKVTMQRRIRRRRRRRNQSVRSEHKKSPNQSAHEAKKDSHQLECTFAVRIDEKD